MHFLKGSKHMIADVDSQATTSCLPSALPPSGPFSSLALVVPGPQDSLLHIHEGATELIHTLLLSAKAVLAVAAGSPRASCRAHSESLAQVLFGYRCSKDRMSCMLGAAGIHLSFCLW